MSHEMRMKKACHETVEVTEEKGYFMLKERHYLYLEEMEYRVLIRSLIRVKKRLIQENQFTDCVDDLIRQSPCCPSEQNLIHIEAAYSSIE